MARVRTPWTPPSADPTPAANTQFGVAMHPDVAIDVAGVWWYQLTTGPTTVRASLWDTSDESLVADSGNVDATEFTANAWNLIPFASAVTLSGDGTYVAATFLATSASVGFDTDDLTSAVTSADGHVTFPAGGGRFGTGSGFVFPASTWNGMHAVDVEYDLTAAEVIPGAGVADLGALAATASGTRTVHGVAAVDLGALVSSGSARRTVHGVGAVSVSLLAIALLDEPTGAGPRMTRTTPTGRRITQATFGRVTSSTPIGRSL